MNRFIIEYVWLDNNKFRSKTKIIKRQKDILKLEDIPIWNFNGYATNQKNIEDSEMIIKPVAIYNDPFRRHKNKLVLCDLWNSIEEPFVNNTRIEAYNLFNLKNELKPMFGIEQEFIILEGSIDAKSIPDQCVKPNPEYYCSVGNKLCKYRTFTDSILYNCFISGLNITGLNFHSNKNHVEIQILNTGIRASDDLIILRYIILRTSEQYNLNIDFENKNDKELLNCDVNFSTNDMREEGGWDFIIDAINKLKMEHRSENNEEFDYGVSNRSCSIRIPRGTEKNKRGYFEDRRYRGCIDPYEITSNILECICTLEEKI